MSGGFRSGPVCRTLPLASDHTDDDGIEEAPAMTTPSTTTLTRERADLIESLRRHRAFLRFTVRT